MEHEVFFERYNVCRNYEGSPLEVGRIGPATTYKAIDQQSNQSVVLQLVPLATIDPARRAEFETRAQAVTKVEHVNVARVLAASKQHDYFAFVTEYLEGETADAWLVANGPMTPDAVLRIGMQVVRGAAAIAFQGLTHRAIQPSNIIILSGESPSGGWPFVKLNNLAVSALELHGETREARELAPATAPQFASPEQVRKEQIDFRSEMYSLGATMCFLLTGAVPLPASGEAQMRGGRRRLPELRSTPKPVRQLLGTMLAEDPEHRPLDPVALERYMVSILGQVERRHALAKKLGIPLAAQVQRQITRSRSPVAQVFRGAVAMAVLLIALAALGAIVYPKYFHRNRSVAEMGVPIGVPTPETSTSAAPGVASFSPNKQTSGPEPSSSPVPSIALARNTIPRNPPAAPGDNIAPPPSSSSLANVTSSQSQTSTSSPVVTQTPITPAQPAPTSPVPVAKNIPPIEKPYVAARTTPPSKKSKPTVSNSVASADTYREPEPEPPAAGPGPDDEDEEDTAPPPARFKQPGQIKPRANVRSKTGPRNYAGNRSSTRGRWANARFIGVTPMGRMLFRLPSGKIVVMTPRHRQRPVAVRPRPYSYPPEPPNYYPPEY